MLPHTRKHTREQTHTRTNTHGHADARTPFQISCWRCINIIIIVITISISAGSAAFVIVIVIVPHCCCYCFSCCRQPTNTHKHTWTSLFYVTGTKCLSLFPHKLHSTIFSIFFTLRTLARFQIFLFFVFVARRLRDTCDYVDVTKRSDGALSRSANSTQLSSLVALSQAVVALALSLSVTLSLARYVARALSVEVSSNRDAAEQHPQ